VTVGYVLETDSS